jgi:hypothetical protein
MKQQEQQQKTKARGDMASVCVWIVIKATIQHGQHRPMTRSGATIRKWKKSKVSKLVNSRIFRGYGFAQRTCFPLF